MNKAYNLEPKSILDTISICRQSKPDIFYSNFWYNGKHEYDSYLDSENCISWPYHVMDMHIDKDFFSKFKHEFQHLQVLRMNLEWISNVNTFITIMNSAPNLRKLSLEKISLDNECVEKFIELIEASTLEILEIHIVLLNVLKFMNSQCIINALFKSRIRHCMLNYYDSRINRDIARHLAGNRSIKSLCICNIYHLSSMMKCLADALPRNTSLEYLSITCNEGCSMLPYGKKFFGAIALNHSIRHLYISKGFASRSSKTIFLYQSMSKMLQINQSLQKLDISVNTNQNAIEIINALKHNQTLRSLSIYLWPNSPGTLEGFVNSIADMLAHNNGLEEFVLEGCQFSASKTHDVLSALIYNQNLSYLRLELSTDCEFSLENLKPLMWNHTLRYLIFSSSETYQNYFHLPPRILSEVITNNPSLKYINVSSRGSSEVDIIKLIESLKYNHSLRDVHLCMINCSPAAFSKLADLFQYNNTLTEIAIDYDTTLFGALNGLQYNTSVRTLRLCPAYCPIDHTCYTNIESKKLCIFCMRQEEALALQETLKYNSTLTDLSGNAYFTNTITLEIKAQLERNITRLEFSKKGLRERAANAYVENHQELPPQETIPDEVYHLLIKQRI